VPIAHQTLDAARRRLDEENKKGRLYQWIFIPMLVALFAVGIGLLIYALTNDKPWAFVTGGLFEVAIAWPINVVIRLYNRRVNVGTIVALLSLAEEKEAQKKVSELIDALLQQVKP